MNRGQDRGNRGRGGGGDGGGGGGSTTGGDQKQRPKKESIIDLSKFVDKQVRVKFQGGREAKGKLKGYDHLLNLVLEDCIEERESGSRNLGLVVCRGPALTVVCPQDGHEAIENPFLE